MHNFRNRWLALLEVGVVLVAAVALFRVLRASPVQAWEMGLIAGQRLLILEYAAVFVLVVLLSAARRCTSEYGITFGQPWDSLQVIGKALLPFLFFGAVLSFAGWRSLPGTLLVSAAALAVLFFTGYILRTGVQPERKAGGLLMIAPVFLLLHAGSLEAVLLRTAYVYLLVGPAEEILFRGYIQSRLNQAFGRPFRFFRVRWGWGVLLASVLFGLWHVLLMPDQPGVWLQAVWTSFAGLALGYLRERSGSIVPSSFLHSVINYLPFADLFAG